MSLGNYKIKQKIDAIASLLAIKKIQNTDKQNPDGVQEQKNFCFLLVGNTKWHTLEESLAVVYSNALTLSIDITLHRIYENEQKVYACKI